MRQPAPPPRAMVNAKVFTADRGHPRAEAVGIAGGVITAVGTAVTTAIGGDVVYRAA